MADPSTFTAADAAAQVRAPTASDDKYRRGVVGMRTGSPAYPGAAVLGVEAAWHTGVGMVRYLGARRPRRLVLQRRPETVTADGRVQAWVVGSGTDASARSPQDEDAVRSVLEGAVPVIVDAGALDLAPRASAPRILTPHARELATLRASLDLTSNDAADEASRRRCAVEAARATGAVVLAKGAVTIVAAPSGESIRVDAATPWLASAGTGDVLAGILGALVASAQADAEDRGQALSPRALTRLAAAGAWIHGQAGVTGARRAGAGVPGPITALQVAAAVPQVVATLIAGGAER